MPGPKAYEMSSWPDSGNYCSTPAGPSGSAWKNDTEVKLTGLSTDAAMNRQQPTLAIFPKDCSATVFSNMLPREWGRGINSAAAAVKAR